MTRAATVTVWAWPIRFPSKPPASNIDFTPFLPVNSTGAIYLDDPHLRTPYVYQYNLSLQRNLVRRHGSGSQLRRQFRAWTDIAAKTSTPMVLGSTNRVLNGTSGNCGPYLRWFATARFPNSRTYPMPTTTRWKPA